MYNRSSHDSETKAKNRENFVIRDLTMREDVIKCQKTYKLDVLTECKEMFTEYLKQCGDQEPVRTSSLWLNKAGNYLASYSHFIPTNQPYAKKVKECIEKAEKNEEKLHNVRAVYNAVIAIKEIHEEMTAKHITGRVKKSIETLLEKFGINAEFNKEKTDEVLNYMVKFYDGKRIYSPIIERTNTFSELSGSSSKHGKPKQSTPR